MVKTFPVSTKGPSVVRYETLMLTVPEITSDESSILEKTFEKLVNKVKGSIVSFEKWGKLRLSYPIRNNEYGVYFLTRFEVPDDQKDALLKQIHSLFDVKYRNILMRYMNTALEMDASLEYQRPESLEDIPTRDVGEFLRENKMEGLLSSVSEDKAEKKESAPVVEEVAVKEATSSEEGEA